MRTVIAAAITVTVLTQCAPATTRQAAPAPVHSVWIDCAAEPPVAHFDLTGLIPNELYHVSFGAQPPQGQYANQVGEIHHTLASGDGQHARSYPMVAAISHPATEFDVRTDPAER